MIQCLICGKEGGLLFKILIYLFIYLLAVPSLSCGMCDLHCGRRDLQLQHVGSLVVACRLLSCSMWTSQQPHACGNQFPDQGLNLGPLHWECVVLPTGPPGKSWGITFKQTSSRIQTVLAKYFYSKENLWCGEEKIQGQIEIK